MDPDILTDRAGLFDLLHDRWFEINEFAFDPDAREARLYLGTKRQGPYDEQVLCISDVESVRVEDQAEVGNYIFGHIQIEVPTVRIISMGAPIEIVLTVGEQCTISLTHTDSYLQSAGLNEPAKTYWIDIGGAITNLLRFLRLKGPRESR